MAKRAGGIKIDISANVARLSADMTKAVGILGGFERQANAIGRNLKMALGGAIFAGLAIGIKQLSSSVFELAEAGDKAGDISSAFEKLGGSADIIKKASESTQGLVDKFDLMKAANEAMIKGLPNVNQNFAQLADLAARVASARDLNPFESLQNLIGAISSGKATGLKEFGILIGDVKSKAEGTAQALNLIPEALQKFDPITLGVADSVSAFKITLDEIYKNIGIGVDSSTQLAGAFARFKAEADPEQMQKFGAALAGIESVIIGIATNALPIAIRLVEDFALGLDSLGGFTKQGKYLKELAQVKSDIETMTVSEANLKQVSGITQYLPGSFFEDNLKSVQQKKAELEAQREKMMSDYNAGLAEDEKEKNDRRSKNTEDYLKRQRELYEKYGFNSGTGKYSAPDSLDSSKLQKLTSDFAKLTGDDLKKNIERAIDSVDVAAFENLKVEMYATTRDSFIKANQDLVSARVATEDQIKRLAEKNAIETVEGYEARMNEAYSRLGEQLKQQHEEAVQSWTGFVDNLFNMDQFDPKNALKDLASGFLSEVLAGLAGGLDQKAQSFYGIGRIIAEGFADSTQSTFGTGTTQPSGAQSSGSGWAGILNGIGSIFSSAQGGMSFAGTAQTAAQNAEWNAAAMEAGSTSSAGAGSGASGAGLSAAQAGGIVAAIQTISAGISAGGIDQKGKDNTGTGGAIGTGIGGTIGAIFGGPMGAAIGAQIGNIAGSMIGGMFKWGPQNPETNARHAFANFVEEGFKKLSTVSFFDAQRRLQTTNAQNFNFLEGPTTRFNDMGDAGANWADNFQAMGSEAVTVFSGLGEAMEEVLGLTEDVGSQIGYLLATNLSGNIDNARLLVQQLGLDLQKMEEALVEAGRTGEMTWLEVEVAIQGVNQAFGEGLVAVGDVAGAFEELVGSGGRGVAALKGVRDLAIEALESGGRTLEDLRARLLAAGKAPEVVDAIIGAIQGRGINSLEELKGANDRVLGGIVADTNAHSETIKQQWEQMDGKIKGFQETLKQLDTQMTKDLTINIKTNFDGNTQQAMDQGVFDGTGADKLTSGPMNTPTTKAAQFRRSVPSEAKAQASAITLNVDARGAERGVHGDIISAMATMEKRIMNRTADMMHQQIRSFAA
jgi:hypothetical protein